MNTDRYWFHVPEVGGVGGKISLPEDQAHHARSVLRLGSGTAVVIFDGQGTWTEGTLQTVGKRGAEVLVAGAIHTEVLPVRKVMLATAVPKGERAEWLIEQASQLNVWCVQWLECDRGVAKPGSTSGKIEKWRRLAVESAKQCGRSWVMQVEPLTPLEVVLAGARARGARILWLEPRAEQALLKILPDLAGATEVVALIGPEGGWSARETALLSGDLKIVGARLTPTVLRIETACAAVAAVLNCG